MFNYLPFLSNNPFCSTQPSLLTCLPLAIASAPFGTSFVIVDPVATYPFSSTTTGATMLEFEPINALSLITDLNLFLPS